jgi:hypothetical protein
MRTTFILLLLLPACFQLNAAVTVLNYYRMGESDSGATAGNLCNNATIDSIGTKNLVKGNGPTYSSDIASAFVGGVANNLSVSFKTSPQDYFLFNSPLSTATTNFVLEAFVKPIDLTSSARFVYNGSQFSSLNGYGFLSSNGIFMAAIGNGAGSLVTFGTAPATTDWVHLAIVRDSSTATFYVNGVANAISAVAPTTPTGSFLIGSTGKVAGIDEVRFSVFSTGQFQTSDLLYQSIPEPSTYMQIFIVAWLFFSNQKLLNKIKYFINIKLTKP